MRLFTNLITKILFIITFIGLIVGYIILSLNMKHQTEYIHTIFNSNSEFLHTILGKVEENALKKEYARHREMITSLSTTFLSIQDNKDKKNVVIDMLDLALQSRGMVAIKILNSDNKIILMAYKENGKTIHTIKQIPKFIVNDSDLTVGKTSLSDGDINGTLVGYFNEDELIGEVIETSELFIEDFEFFMEELRDLEEEVMKHKPIAFILFTLILVITTFFTIEIMVSSPLKKIQKGLDSFFSSLGNDNALEIKKITINTRDEFEDMAKSLNNQISNGISLHRELNKAKKKMQDAISHSSTIQKSFIKNNALMYYFFDDFFIHWEPRDVVGGDVYFFEQVNDDECILMCIDCTGHSVHGALIAVLVKAIHFQIMEDIKKGFIRADSPSQVLGYFNKRIKLILDQHNEQSNSDIGFDGGVICYNKKDKLIKYSGAKIPLLYIDDKSNEINVLKSNEYSVGYKFCDIDYEYKEDTIKIHTGMEFYIATDGFIDQMGGKNNLRFGKSRFHKMIKLYHDKSFAEQKDFYIQQLREYKGAHESTDDITFIGFKI